MIEDADFRAEPTFFENLGTAFVGPLIFIVCMLVIGTTFGTHRPLPTLALFVLASYVGALIAKLLLAELYPQSVVVMAVGFHLNALATLSIFYIGDAALTEVIPKHLLMMFRGVFGLALLGASGFANYRLARTDFGFSGPVSWRHTGPPLVLLLILALLFAPSISGTISSPNEFEYVEHEMDVEF